MIYLDNAATTRFKPTCMIETMATELKTSSNSGRGGHNDSIDLAIKIFDARQTIKSFYHAPDDYPLVFTHNCTDALNLALLGYLRNFSKQKINVVLTANEHNSVLRPLYYLSQTQPLTLTIVKPQPDGSISTQSILSAIQPDTRLVCVCHISNVTGASSPIADIGAATKSKGVALLVDTAQSSGHLPINMP
ncbi:MAG: aminotransferase class V-fold PLP-dependent enzyme, partial [Clostridia bacterium]